MPIHPRTRLFPLALLLLAGCGGGGMTLVTISPATQTIDVGTTVNLAAAVVNDGDHAGATYKLAGPGTLGTASVTPHGDSETILLPYTATAVGTATITATSVHAPSQVATAQIVVGPALTIAPATLPAGMVGATYNASVTATGGTGAFTYMVSAGTLPTGLALTGATGVLSGKPSVAGAYAFTITATDAATVPGTVSQAYTVLINSQPPVVTPATLATGVVGSAYTQQLAYTGGGAGAPSFAITSGSLPASSGLTLSAAGLISGTPAAAAAGQTYTFAVAVTVGNQTSPAVGFTLNVAAIPVITTTSLPPGNVGSAYSQQLAYTGGSGTASFAVTSGSLPASSGLTLSSSGLVSGKPTLATTYNFSVTVTVGTQSSAPQAYTLVINSLIVTSSATPQGEAGLPFSFRLTAAGGTGSYTWALAAGSAALPAGLSLNGTTGLITGSLASSTGSPFTGIVVQATDTAGATATQSMTYTVFAARAATSNALLTGAYAFLLTGFDAKGNPQASAGRFLADGAGNITGGTLDTNGTGLATAQTAVAILPSTYSVGADNRGKLTIVTSAGTSTFTVALDTVTSGVAAGGTLSEFDLSGQTRVGSLSLQTTPAFPVTTGASGYAFGLQGFAANTSATAPTHRAAAGEFQLNAGTTVTSAEILLSSTNTPAPNVVSSSTFSLAATGRGTLALTLPNLGTFNFIVYTAATGKLYLLSSDNASGTSGPRDLLSGQALLQTTANGSFNNASLNATAVFYAQKLTAGNPDLQIGLLTFPGSGTAAESFDENNAGALNASTASGTYAVASNGRTTLTLGTAGLGGCTDCASLSGYAYLVGANSGYLMDFSSGALTGFFEPQTATTVATGNYTLATPRPLSAASTSATGTAAFSTGALTIVEDTSTQLTLTPDLTLSGTDTAAASGRITTTLTGPGYVVSAARTLVLDTTTKPALQIFQHQ